MDFLSTYLDDAGESQKPARPGPVSQTKTNGRNDREESRETQAHSLPGLNRKNRKVTLPSRLDLASRSDDKQMRFQDAQDFIPPLIIDGDSMLMTPKPRSDAPDSFAFSPMADSGMPPFSKIDSMRTVFLTPKSIMRRAAPKETQQVAPNRQPEEDAPANSFFDFFRGPNTN